MVHRFKILGTRDENLEFLRQDKNRKSGKPLAQTTLVTVDFPEPGLPKTGSVVLKGAPIFLSHLVSSGWGNYLKQTESQEDTCVRDQKLKGDHSPGVL